MIDTTAVEMTNGDCALVELDEAAGTIAFETEAGQPIRTYSTTALATVSGPLALDLGRGLIVNAEWIAGLKQWARI